MRRRIDLDFRLLLHVLHHARAGNFPLETRQDEANALADVETLEHFLLVGNAQVHVRGREVGKPARVGHVHLEDLRHFARDAID